MPSSVYPGSQGWNEEDWWRELLATRCRQEVTDSVTSRAGQAAHAGTGQGVKPEAGGEGLRWTDCGSSRHISFETLGES